MSNESAQSSSEARTSRSASIHARSARSDTPSDARMPLDSNSPAIHSTTAAINGQFCGIPTRMIVNAARIPGHRTVMAARPARSCTKVARMQLGDEPRREAYLQSRGLARRQEAWISSTLDCTSVELCIRRWASRGRPASGSSIAVHDLRRSVTCHTLLELGQSRIGASRGDVAVVAEIELRQAQCTPSRSVQALDLRAAPPVRAARGPIVPARGIDVEALAHE